MILTIEALAPGESDPEGIETIDLIEVVRRVGRMILSADGEVLSGSGMCFVKDVSGDGVNHAWKVEEVGTSTCPDICGSWRMVDAFGKFEGTTGSGTFRRTHVFSDGVMGSYTSTYTR